MPRANRRRFRSSDSSSNPSTSNGSSYRKQWLMTRRRRFSSRFLMALTLLGSSTDTTTTVVQSFSTGATTNLPRSRQTTIAAPISAGTVLWSRRRVGNNGRRGSSIGNGRRQKQPPRGFGMLKEPRQQQPTPDDNTAGPSQDCSTMSSKEDFPESMEQFLQDEGERHPSANAFGDLGRPLELAIDNIEYIKNIYDVDEANEQPRPSNETPSNEKNSNNTGKSAAPRPPPRPPPMELFEAVEWNSLNTETEAARTALVEALALSPIVPRPPATPPPLPSLTNIGTPAAADASVEPSSPSVDFDREDMDLDDIIPAPHPPSTRVPASLMNNNAVDVGVEVDGPSASEDTTVPLSDGMELDDDDETMEPLKTPPTATTKKIAWSMEPGTTVLPEDGEEENMMNEEQTIKASTFERITRVPYPSSIPPPATPSIGRIATVLQEDEEEMSLINDDQTVERATFDTNTNVAENPSPTSSSMRRDTTILQEDEEAQSMMDDDQTVEAPTSETNTSVLYRPSSPPPLSSLPMGRDTTVFRADAEEMSVMNSDRTVNASTIETNNIQYSPPTVSSSTENDTSVLQNTEKQAPIVSVQPHPPRTPPPESLIGASVTTAAAVAMDLDDAVLDLTAALSSFATEDGECGSIQPTPPRGPPPTYILQTAVAEQQKTQRQAEKSEPTIMSQRAAPRTNSNIEPVVEHFFADRFIEDSSSGADDESAGLLKTLQQLMDDGVIDPDEDEDQTNLFYGTVVPTNFAKKDEDDNDEENDDVDDDTVDVADIVSKELPRWIQNRQRAFEQALSDTPLLSTTIQPAVPDRVIQGAALAGLVCSATAVGFDHAALDVVAPAVTAYMAVTQSAVGGLVRTVGGLVSDTANACGSLYQQWDPDGERPGAAISKAWTIASESTKRTAMMWNEFHKEYHRQQRARKMEKFARRLLETRFQCESKARMEQEAVQAAQQSELERTRGHERTARSLLAAQVQYTADAKSFEGALQKESKARRLLTSQLRQLSKDRADQALLLKARIEREKVQTARQAELKRTQKQKRTSRSLLSAQLRHRAEARSFDEAKRIEGNARRLLTSQLHQLSKDCAERARILETRKELEAMQAARQAELERKQIQERTSRSLLAAQLERRVDDRLLEISQLQERNARSLLTSQLHQLSKKRAEHARVAELVPERESVPASQQAELERKQEQERTLRNLLASRLRNKAHARSQGEMKASYRLSTSQLSKNGAEQAKVVELGPEQSRKMIPHDLLEKQTRQSMEESQTDRKRRRENISHNLLTTRVSVKADERARNVKHRNSSENKQIEKKTMHQLLLETQQGTPAKEILAFVTQPRGEDSVEGMHQPEQSISAKNGASLVTAPRQEENTLHVQKPELALRHLQERRNVETRRKMLQHRLAVATTEEQDNQRHLVDARLRTVVKKARESEAQELQKIKSQMIGRRSATATVSSSQDQVGDVATKEFPSTADGFSFYQAEGQTSSQTMAAAQLLRRKSRSLKVFLETNEGTDSHIQGYTFVEHASMHLVAASLPLWADDYFRATEN